MDRDQKHSCKFCRKSFNNGRALGGHMRSHVPTNSSKSDELENKLQASRNLNGFGSAGYGLRENPKKTWRFSDSAIIFGEKRCRECGREFQSWKALFGHMRSHSDKAREEEEEEGEGSHLIGGAMVVSVPRRKRRSRRSASKSVLGSSSSSMSEYEKEQEEVAMSLMMLSRDVGNWGSGFGFGFSHVAESSDKNSAVLEDHHHPHQEFVCKGSELGSDTGHFDSKENSDDSFKKRKKMMVEVCDDRYGSKLVKDLEMGRSKYECTTCSKSFHTYQALGGHRAGHKRMRGCLPSKGGVGSENSLVVETSIDQVTENRHQCLICGKMFSSGQALGGHKRSHFVTAPSSSSVVVQQETEEEDAVIMPVLIDLNLPARIDENSSSKAKESDSVVADIEFDSWWAGSNLQRDAMLGMIAS